MSSFSAFFSTQEFRSVYECLFENMSSAFLSGTTDLSVTQLHSLANLLEFYDLTIRLRNSRRMPMSVCLTLECVRYFVERHKILKSVTDPNMVASLATSLSISSATRVFKILNQIVDLSQKSKFALSFQHILKKLGFVECSLLAHLRNALFHQETPSQRNTERALRILLREVKVLFWDKNYYWLLKLDFAEDETKRRCHKFSVAALEKHELNDVDAASDLAMAEKELENFLGLKGQAPLDKDAVAEFIKEKVKGLHRKIAVAHLAAQHTVRICAKLVVATSKEQESLKTSSMQNFLHILLYLCEIFASNKNMHRVFDDLSFRNNIEHVCMMHQVLGLDIDLFRKIAEKSQGRIFKQLLGPDDKTKPANSFLGKRNSSEVEADKAGPQAAKKKPDLNQPDALADVDIAAECDQFERDFNNLFGIRDNSNINQQTRVRTGSLDEIQCIDEEEAALLNRLLPEEPEKIGSRTGSRKGSFSYTENRLQNQSGPSESKTPQLPSKGNKPKPLVLGRKLMQHFLVKEREAEAFRRVPAEKQREENRPRDLAFVLANCATL